MQEVVQKAGGVVIRENNNGEKEMYVIHRPHHDDWSLPKGHVDPGEGMEEAALREVLEETGFRCEIIRELPVYEYMAPTHPSAVWMYEMHMLEDTGVVDNESDEGHWLTIEEAVEKVSYDTLQEYIKQQYA